MQRLVDYESSDESEDVAIKLVQHEEFEVSTMAEEGVPLDPTHDSDEILSEKPQQIRCSHEQAAEGQQIRCSHEQAAEAPIVLLATPQQNGCSHEQAAQAPIGPTHDVDEILLAKPQQMGCSHEQSAQEPIGPMHDSDEILLAKLLEFGCSHEQAAQALSVCGRGAPIPELFDYIQACNCNIGDEGCASKALDFEEDPETLLKDMGYTQVYILNALKACGKQSTILEIVDFIQAHYCIEDSSCSENKVAERDLIGLNRKSREKPSKQLQEMGCSYEDIAKAISACGENTHVSDLLDFIQACQYPIGDEGCALDAPAFEEDVPLNETGFTQGHITDASRAPGKESPTLDIADFIQAHYCNGEDDVADVAHDKRQTTIADEPVPINLAQQSADINVTKETMVAERDLIGLYRKSSESPTKQLQEMGCSCEGIAKAISVCGENTRVSDLFDFIQASQYPIGDEGCTLDAPSFEEDVPLNEIGFTQGHITDALRACGKQSSTLDIADFIQVHYCNGDERKDLSASPPTFVAREDGPSKSMAKRVKWTRNQTKIWSSFEMQKKKAIGCSNSEESDHDCLESTWEGPEEEKMANFNPYCSSWQQERMMGFGIPGHLNERPRPLPKCMQGPPYFYFENVAIVIDNAWNTIKLHFNGVEPEFVDSRFFSATRRRRGYVHNLPVQNRKLILPSPPMTIFEALPHTRQYWPYWDTRDKLNCITTKGPMLAHCGSIRDLLSNYESLDVPDEVQQHILKDCKKYNLVWVGPNELASLEVNEIELLLGFDIGHTRGCSSMTDRYEMLGSSFQINTVAYHMSPLKSLFPKGITVLSLFTGIGGAEVALHKIGIFLKRVVVVEKVEKARDIFFSWWKKSGQKGELKFKYQDVKELTYEVLTELIDEVGEIDLVIGGSPCNNLSGNNRWNRNGLNGPESSLFFEFPRILNNVKKIMEK